MSAGGGERVAQQAGNGHWPDTARHRCDVAGHFRRFAKSDIADKFHLGLSGIIEAFFRRRHAINADIYDARTRLDPIAPDHFGNADSGDENIGIPAQVRQVVRARMGDADRAIFAKQ